MVDRALKKRSKEERRAQEGFQSRGREELRHWLNSGGHSQEFLAGKLDVSQVAVNAWLHGRSRPIAVHRVAIELLTGIQADGWELEDGATIRDEALRILQGEKAS
jgi:transcriptional regulator with XRE-family HTH domain